MPDDPRPPFDENAALEELERLREEIREVRSRREKKVEEFETWVRETRTASRAERIAALDETQGDHGAATAARTATRAADAAHPTSVSAAAPAIETDRSWIPLEDAFKKEDERAASKRRAGGRGVYYAGGAAAVLMAIAVLPRILNNREPEDVRAGNATQPAAEQSPAAPRQPPETTLPPIRETPAASPPVADPSPPVTDSRPLQIELVTIRPVWLRVTVDGQRRLEREVPAGQRLAFGADRAINVRAGNGGSLRLTVGGRDLGLFGRDGQIADRTLTPR